MFSVMPFFENLSNPLSNSTIGKKLDRPFPPPNDRRLIRGDRWRTGSGSRGAGGMDLSHPAGACLFTGITVPSPGAFPTYPASWYLFCRSCELREKPQSRYTLGRELVAFRTSSGRVAVLNARCSHLRADLGRGRVLGEAIQCPYHHWEYGPDGRCIHIPSQESIPDFARQSSYPVMERHGYVFFFNGPEALFPLPFFPDCRTEDFTASKPLHFLGDFSWFLFAANSFDVHGLPLDQVLSGLESLPPS